MIVLSTNSNTVLKIGIGYKLAVTKIYVYYLFKSLVGTSGIINLQDVGWCGGHIPVLGPKELEGNSRRLIIEEFPRDIQDSKNCTLYRL